MEKQVLLNQAKSTAFYLKELVTLLASDYYYCADETVDLAFSGTLDIIYKIEMKIGEKKRQQIN